MGETKRAQFLRVEIDLQRRLIVEIGRAHRGGGLMRARFRRVVLLLPGLLVARLLGLTCFADRDGGLGRRRVMTVP